jgi:hypothetical protein
LPIVAAGASSMRAEAEWWEPLCGHADSPERRLTARIRKARLQPNGRNAFRASDGKLSTAAPLTS